MLCCYLSKITGFHFLMLLILFFSARMKWIFLLQFDLNIIEIEATLHVLKEKKGFKISNIHFFASKTDTIC